jgi:hypothetical protein
LSLRLLIDEDTLAKLLVETLRQAGHDMTTVHEAALTGEPDERVLQEARRPLRGETLPIAG